MLKNTQIESRFSIFQSEFVHINPQQTKGKKTVELFGPTKLTHVRPFVRPFVRLSGLFLNNRCGADWGNRDYEGGASNYEQLVVSAFIIFILVITI